MKIFRPDREALIIEAIRSGCDTISAIAAATSIPRGTLGGALAVMYATHDAEGLFDFRERVRRNEIKPQVKRSPGRRPPPLRPRRRDFITMDTGMAPSAAAFFVAQWDTDWVSQFCDELGRELVRNAKLSME